MSQNPSPPAPIVVHVDFSKPTDKEAYVARFSREVSFVAKSEVDAREPIDVRLVDHCDPPTNGASSVPTVRFVRHAGTTDRQPCHCCWSTTSGESWAELLQQLAAACGRDPVAVQLRDELAGLTRREHDVLRLVGQGKSVSECAEAMGVAQSTVGNHKYRLMRKLGVTTSLQLLRIAVRNGLADL